MRQQHAEMVLTWVTSATLRATSTLMVGSYTWMLQCGNRPRTAFSEVRLSVAPQAEHPAGSPTQDLVRGAHPAPGHGREWGPSRMTCQMVCAVGMHRPACTPGTSCCPDGNRQYWH